MIAATTASQWDITMRSPMPATHLLTRQRTPDDATCTVPGLPAQRRRSATQRHDVRQHSPGVAPGVCRTLSLRTIAPNKR